MPNGTTLARTGVWIRVVFWLRVVLFGQLAIGLLVVVVTGQRPLAEVVAVQAQAFSDRASAIEARVKSLEDIRIGERLAVLDRLETDAHETKMLNYGMVLTLLGTLALGLFERRNRKGDR